MDTRDNIINRDLIIGWATIVIVLFVAYLGEVIKGERTWPYLVVFMLFTGIPQIAATFIYRKNPSSYNLRYIIVIGYFFMYTFVMITGSTFLVFTYILPLMSFLILYHQEKLLLYTGIASFFVNVIFVIIQIANDRVTLASSKDMEIQFALLALCFSGGYVSAKLYGSITKSNNEYIAKLDDKTKELKRMTVQTITTIANTIDAKDEYTKGHSYRVAQYSQMLARELGMSDEDVENVHAVALLHDIGKIGVPDSILNKPGRLTDEEYAIMKKHPSIGAEILKDINILDGLDIGAKYHHERFDGRGYPDGLKGNDIPYISKIIGIADAYDAMSSNRVYRKRFSDEKILEEIEKCKGTQFDPDVADAFIKLLKEKRLNNLSPDVVEEKKKADASSEVMSVDDWQDTIEEKNNEKSLLERLGQPKNMEAIIIQELKNGDGCFFLIDLDNIGMVNEKYGFHRGDYYLSIIAQTLIDYKEKLYVSRIDGDEFLCYLPNVESIIDAEAYVMNLMNTLYTTLKKHDEKEKITLSVGVSLSAVSGRDYKQLYIDADKALYHVKQTGKNGFYIYNDVNKIENKNISKQDLDNLVKIIREEYSYTGAFKVDYNEFEKVYEFVRNMGKRNAQTVQLILFTVKPADEKNVDLYDRNNVMQYLENAIIETVRSVDVTTRYSSTQQLVMFINLNDNSIQIVVERIMKEFYQMYDKGDMMLTYDIANLNFN